MKKRWVEVERGGREDGDDNGGRGGSKTVVLNPFEAVGRPFRILEKYLLLSGCRESNFLENVREALLVSSTGAPVRVARGDVVSESHGGACFQTYIRPAFPAALARVRARFKHH